MLLKTYTKVLLQRHIPATVGLFSCHEGYVIAAILLQQHGCTLLTMLLALYLQRGTH
jgi:hypothetical protein